MEERSLPKHKQRKDHVVKHKDSQERQTDDQMEKGIAETHQQIADQFLEGTIDQLINQ